MRWYLIYVIIGMFTLGQSIYLYTSCRAVKNPSEVAGLVVLAWPTVVPTLWHRTCPSSTLPRRNI